MQKRYFEKISRTFKSATISRTFECATNSRTVDIQALRPIHNGSFWIKKLLAILGSYLKICQK